jgi:pimeloyl-ACP methyl ester carboxylesterase
MKRILFLHGLESSNICDKTKFLQERCILNAPSIDYSSPSLEEDLMYIVESFQPDLIIGSSMGGHVGLMLANYYNIDSIVFNPAIHSRPLEPKLKRLEAKEPNINIQPLIVLGLEDTVISPNETVKLLNESDLDVTYEIYPYLGHRISIDVFVDIYNKYIK